MNAKSNKLELEFFELFGQIGLGFHDQFVGSDCKIGGIRKVGPRE